MIYIYGYDLDLLNRHSNSLKNYDYKILEFEELFKNKYLLNDILIISNINLNKIENLELIEKLTNLDIKIIVLDSVPSFEKGKKIIALGIKAYANMMINDIHLSDVINSVKDGNVWLYPEFINNLVSNISSERKKENVDIDLDILTDREKVALLVLKKMTYSEISEELDISLRTVKAHTKHIYEKYNVLNRLAFILKYHK